ncbi:unnamed protein product, partial [Rotaria sp. Silwood2]
FPDEVDAMNLISLLKEDNLCPLLYSCIHRDQHYFYLTYSKRILIDFDTQTDLAYMMAVLLAVYYVLDIKYPRHNKPILEIFDYIALHGNDTNMKMKSSFLKKLTVAAQNIIVEYEKKMLG